MSSIDGYVLGLLWLGHIFVLCPCSQAGVMLGVDCVRLLRVNVAPGAD